MNDFNKEEFEKRIEVLINEFKIKQFILAYESKEEDVNVFSYCNKKFSFDYIRNFIISESNCINFILNIYFFMKTYINNHTEIILAETIKDKNKFENLDIKKSNIH